MDAIAFNIVATAIGAVAVLFLAQWFESRFERVQSGSPDIEEEKTAGSDEDKIAA